jgi:hypothetical protein
VVHHPVRDGDLASVGAAGLERLHVYLPAFDGLENLIAPRSRLAVEVEKGFWAGELGVNPRLGNLDIALEGSNGFRLQLSA